MAKRKQICYMAAVTDLLPLSLIIGRGRLYCRMTSSSNVVVHSVAVACMSANTSTDFVAQLSSTINIHVH